MSPTTNVPPSTASQKRLFESQILLAQHGVLLHQRHQTRCQLTRGALLLVVVAGNEGDPGEILDWGSPSDAYNVLNVGATGRMSRNASTCASSYTTSAGIFLETMLQKRQPMRAGYRPRRALSRRSRPPRADLTPRGSPRPDRLGA